MLTSGPYPTRDVEANLADVAAQVAANRQGAQRPARAGRAAMARPVVAAYMDHVQDAAERKVRQALARLPVGTHAFTDYLETVEGASVPIAVRFTIHAAGSPHGRNDRFHRHGPGRRGQPQRQSGDRHRGGDLRAAAAGRRRHPAQPRRAAADRDRAARVPAQSSARRDCRKRRRPWPAATSKLRSAWSTCCSARWGSPAPARAR